MTTVTVTVPEDTLFLLRRYATQLCAGGGHDAVRGQGETEALTQGDPDAVRCAYLGGNSENWRPFLDHLADSPGVWVDWPELCDIIGLTPNQAAGMLGAAERRCKGAVPYEKRESRGVRYFRMSADNTRLVKQLYATR
jgi:hypothetical protein